MREASMENYTNDRFFSKSSYMLTMLNLFTFVLIVLYNDIITKKKITYIFDDHL